MSYPIQFPYVINPRALQRTSRPPVRRAFPRQQQQQRIQRMPVMESHYFDSGASSAINEGNDWSASNIEPTTYPVVGINTLFAPTEGDDINNRQGRKVAVYKIAIRGVITTAVLSDQADIVANPAVRLVMFMDQQPNGATALGNAVMGPPFVSASPAIAFNAFQNTANFGRFRVLRDQTYMLPVVTAGTDGASTNSLACQDVPIKMTVKFKKPIIVKFNGTNGGTIADLVSNAFGLLAHKSGAGFATTITYQCRTYYKDI